MLQITKVTLAGLIFASTAHAELKGYVCMGTEPFYSVDIDVKKGELTYVAPEVIDGESYKISGPKHAAGMSEDSVAVFQGQNVSATILSASISGACSDGMSDNSYDYHLVLTKGDRVLYGCCELKAQDE